jgi:arsenical pump membrane protein
VGLAGGLAGGQVSLRRLGRQISWSLFPFIAGMLIVVQWIENAGLTAAPGRAILGLAGHNPLQAALAGAFGSALTSNLVNNVPTMMLLRSALHTMAGVGAGVQRALVYSIILGSDLGPNITIIGSLSTILWLVILRRKGLKVSPTDYIRIGIVVTPVMIAVGALWIGLVAGGA